MKKIVILLAVSLSFLISEPIKTTKSDIGLIRKIKVYKYPKWVAKVVIKNTNKEVLFCSPKSMFEFYFQPSRFKEFGVKDLTGFKSITVTNYNNLDAIPALKAFFVYGSRAISPAGDDLPAFSTKKEAEDFAKKYSGKRVFSFGEVKFALIKLLNGRI